MKESPNKRAVIVGFFILIGLLFLAGGILLIGNLHETFAKKLQVTTMFDDVNGLKKGDNIWFSGVKIGTVKQVSFFNKSLVKVVMNIDEKAREYIRKDAKVKVSTDGFIGNKILVIYGGTFKAGPVAQNDTLGVEKIFSTEDILNTLQENNKNILIITKNLVEGHGSIGKLLKDETVYNNISAMSISLKNASGNAEHLTNSLSVFSSNLNKKGTFANQLATDTTVFNSIKKTTQQLNRIVDTASQVISNFNMASKNPNSFVGVLLRDDTSGAHLKSILKNLDSGSKNLNADLIAAQHSFLLRHYFKKAAKKKTTQ